MRTSDFSFELPDGLVPDQPPEARGLRRDDARLAVIVRDERRIEHATFSELGRFLSPRDVLVVNDSAVVNDQISGHTRRGRVRLILCGHHRSGWLALVRPARHAQRGTVVEVGGGELSLELIRHMDHDLWLVEPQHDAPLLDVLERYGARYAPRAATRRARTSQNVYAGPRGSLEVPSAGLHFSEAHLARLADLGIGVVPITLHVGLSEIGQYREIEEENVEDHEVPEEWYSISAESAARLNEARADPARRIVAVGTTVVRTLETLMRGGKATFVAAEGWTDLYIHPGFEFRAVDALLTNLHQPRSSHLVLVAAFAGRPLTLDAYREVAAKGYAFDVFGDSMLVV